MRIRNLLSRRNRRETTLGVWTVGAATLIGSWASWISAQDGESQPVAIEPLRSEVMQVESSQIPEAVPVSRFPNKLRDESSVRELTNELRRDNQSPVEIPSASNGEVVTKAEVAKSSDDQLRRIWSVIGMRVAAPKAQRAIATEEMLSQTSRPQIQTIQYPDASNSYINESIPSPSDKSSTSSELTSSAESTAVPVVETLSPNEPYAASPEPTEVSSPQPAIVETAPAPALPATMIQRSFADNPQPATDPSLDAVEAPVVTSKQLRRPIAVSPNPALRPSAMQPSAAQSAVATSQQPSVSSRGVREFDSRRPMIREDASRVKPVEESATGLEPTGNIALEKMRSRSNLIAIQQEPVRPAEKPENPNPLAQPDSPFSVIEQSGEIKVTVRRSKLLQTKNDIFRTAVVDPSICDVIQFSPKELSIIGRGVGSTHVTFWFDGNQQRPHTYLVTVEPDASVRKQVEVEYQMLEDIIAELFPDSKVRLTVMADKLIVRGQAKDSAEAAQIMAMVRAQSGYGNVGGSNIGVGGGPAARVLSDAESGQTGNQRPMMQVINMLRVPGVQQVALRVKIAELNRSAARGFGLDVRGHINFTQNANGAKMFLNSVLNMAGGGVPILAQFDGDDITLGLRYLQSHGVVRLISEPTLVTMSGTAATFVAGGEFAVPTIVGAAGLNAVTTDFRSFGAIISFLPTVIDKDHIRLQIAPEFSQVNRELAVGGTPGLNSRSVTTTVEMREGQTFAVAGLLEDNIRTSTSSDLPFVAKLFGKRDASHNETELLILVTPELVHPMEPEEVPPLPGFDVTEPDNYQFFLRGDIEGNPTRDYRSTVWPRLRQRYNSGGTSMISGPFGHGQ